MASRVFPPASVALLGAISLPNIPSPGRWCGIYG